MYSRVTRLLYVHVHCYMYLYFPTLHPMQSKFKKNRVNFDPARISRIEGSNRRDICSIIQEGKRKRLGRFSRDSLPPSEISRCGKNGKPYRELRGGFVEGYDPEPRGSPSRFAGRTIGDFFSFFPFFPFPEFRSYARTRELRVDHFFFFPFFFFFFFFLSPS